MPSKVIFEIRRPSFRVYIKELRRQYREQAEREMEAYFDTILPTRPPTGPCGAKTRAGTPCKLKAVYASGRCKFHGGLSTGPNAPAGKAR